MGTSSAAHWMGVLLFGILLTDVATLSSPWPGTNMGFEADNFGSGQVCSYVDSLTGWACDECSRGATSDHLLIHSSANSCWELAPIGASAVGAYFVALQSNPHGLSGNQNHLAYIDQNIILSPEASSNGFTVTFKRCRRSAYAEPAITVMVSDTSGSVWHTCWQEDTVSDTTFVEKSCTIAASTASSLGGTMILRVQNTGSSDAGGFAGDKMLFLDDFQLAALPPDGAIIELTGEAPKIIFGNADEPVCELTLDRANGRLESTCAINENRRRSLGEEIAIRKEIHELKSEVLGLRDVVDKLTLGLGRTADGPGEQDTLPPPQTETSAS